MSVTMDTSTEVTYHSLEGGITPPPPDDGTRLGGRYGWI